MDATQDNPTTVKHPIVGVRKMDEMEWAQYKYDKALKRMLKDPSPENIKLFEDANRVLWETQDLYRLAQRLLIQRARNVISATKAVFFGKLA